MSINNEVFMLKIKESKHKKNSNFFISQIFVLGVFILFTQSVFAQFKDPETAIDKEKQKKTTKTEVKKETAKTVKIAPKKVVAPPQPEVVRASPPPKPTPRPRPVRQKKTSPAASKNNDIYLFILPEAGLEVLIDDQKQGKYADENAEIEMTLSVGKHRFIIRRNGQIIGDANLIISKDKKEIDLSPYINENAVYETDVKPNTPTATKNTSVANVTQPNQKKVETEKVTQPVTTPISKKSGIGIIFILPEAGLEVLVDDQKKGKYSDKDGRLQMPVANGKRRFTIRRNGQPIGDAILTISKDKKEINLTPYITEDSVAETVDKSKVVDIKTTTQPEQTVEKGTPQTQIKPNTVQQNVSQGDEAQIALNKIREINAKYKDPKQSEKVSIQEWEFMYNKAISPDGLPESLDPKLKNAFMSFAAGQIFLTQQRGKDAVREFSNAVTLTSLVNQESAVAHFALATAYRVDKQIDEARKSYERAIRLDPTLALAYYQLAEMLYQNGNQAASSSYYLKAIELGYGSVQTSLRYANGLKFVSRCDEAIKVYEKINTQVQNAESYQGLGECYYSKKLTLRAVDALQKALEIDGSNIFANQKLGQIYYENGDYGLAINYLQRALDLDKDGKIISTSQTQELLKKAKKKNSK
jgi:tetratricopeptide (TPR) repeat protein